METEMAIFVWIFLYRNFFQHLTINSYGGFIPILLLSILSRTSVKKDINVITTMAPINGSTASISDSTAPITTTSMPTTVGCVFSCETLSLEVGCENFGCDSPQTPGPCISRGNPQPITCEDVEVAVCSLVGCRLIGPDCEPETQLLECETLVPLIDGGVLCENFGCCITDQATGRCISV